MMKISGSGCAAFAICLAFLQPAFAQVNAETDARAFIVREAEIRHQAAAAEQASDSQVATPEAAETKHGRKASAKAERGVREARKPLAAPAGSEGLRALVARHAAANGVPFALADAVVRIESRYNPRAAHAGNFGLMQIRHATARSMGFDGPASGLFDAETNLKYAVKYLRGAWVVAGNDRDNAVRLYARGYYYDAKRKGMLHVLRK